jgi:hypothetical protein
MKIRLLVHGLWISVALAGCAEQRAQEPAAEAAPVAPAAAPAPQGLDQPRSSEGARDEEFANLEAAERALNQAKSDLDRLALAGTPATVGRAAPADGARAEKKDAKAGQAPTAAGAAASSAPSALCENACRAFASLSRAANAVCRLDGNGGSHCSRAKRVVADSQQRVASCACPSGD